MLAAQIEADEDEPLFELALAARDRYAEIAPELEAATGLSIGLRADGIARVAPDEAEAAALKAKVAWQRQQGHTCDWLDPAEVRERWPWAGPTQGALWAPHDGAVDPVLLVRALLADASRLGVSVVQDTVTRIEREGGRAIGVAGRERYHAADVIVAAGAWSGRLEGLPRPLSVEPVRGQMAALEWPAGRAPATLYNGKCYLLARGPEAILGSTMEYGGYDASVTEAGQQRIRDALAALAPTLATAPALRTWAGLRPVTPDGLPIVGAAPDLANLWYATGHGRNGILFAAGMGQWVAQMLQGEPLEAQLQRLAPDRLWRW